MRHTSEEDLILYYYGESSDRSAVESHLPGCPECRRELETLRSVLATVSPPPVPERGEDYGSAVWRRIRPRLVPRSTFDVRRLMVAAAVAALVAGGFLAGRFWPRPEPSAPLAESPTKEPSARAQGERKASPGANVGSPEPTGRRGWGPVAGDVGPHELIEVRERVLLVAVGEHLERSEILLIELSNGGIALPGQARELVASNRLYRHAALSSGEIGVLSLLDELEPLLLELAHDPEGLDRALQKRVEAQGILFKVRVLGAGLRERALPPGAKKM